MVLREDHCNGLSYQQTNRQTNNNNKKHHMQVGREFLSTQNFPFGSKLVWTSAIHGQICRKGRMEGNLLTQDTIPLCSKS